MELKMNKPLKENILQVYGREPETLDELARCVIHMIESQENVDLIRRKNRSVKKMHKVLGFAWDIRYSDSVGNSHSSPEGYSQNWRRKENVPMGYPGWSGRVWIRYSEEYRGAPFNKTLTHTGTGGSGGYGGPWAQIGSVRFNRYKSLQQIPKDAYPEPKIYSWDYKFYDLDWPAVALWVEQQKVWGELSDQPWQNRHKFCWEDHDTLVADSAFIAECATIKAMKTVCEL
jgi:hypothetical protein